MSRDNVSVTITAHDKASAQLIKMQKESRKLDKEMDALRGSMIAGGASVDQFGRRLKQQGQQYTQATRSVRNMRGVYGQLGFQVQDVAVQLQHGTNALVVLGQQGSQVASIFGPGGAMFGAVLAVGAALGTAFLPKLFESKKSLSELSDELVSAAGGMDKLTAAQRRLVELGISQKIIEQQQALRDASSEAEAARSRYMKMAQAIASGDRAAGGLSDEMVSQAQAMNVAGLEAAIAQATIDSLRESMEELKGSTATVEDEFAEMVASLNQQYQELVLSESALRAYNDEMQVAALLAQGATAEQVAAVRALQARIEAQKQLNAAEEGGGLSRRDASQAQSIVDSLGGKEAQIRAAYQRQLEIIREAREQQLDLGMHYNDIEAAMYQQMLQDVEQAQFQSAAALLNGFQSQFSALQGLFQEASGAAKAFYVAQQSMAAANAIISALSAGEKAKEQALAMKLSLPAAEAIKTATVAGGYATAGAIMGQTLASFEGGGYTGAGIRAGGLDGKGGHLAMVHPNETIIDHEKGGSAGNVNINFAITANDTKGFDQLINSRRGMFYNMVREALSDQGRRI